MGGDGGDRQVRRHGQCENTGRIETWNEYALASSRKVLAVVAERRELWRGDGQLQQPDSDPGALSEVGNINIAARPGRLRGTGGKAGDVLVTNDGRITTDQDYALRHLGAKRRWRWW